MFIQSDSTFGGGLTISFGLLVLAGRVPDVVRLPGMCWRWARMKCCFATEERPTRSFPIACRHTAQQHFVPSASLFALMGLVGHRWNASELVTDELLLPVALDTGAAVPVKSVDKCLANRGSTFQPDPFLHTSRFLVATLVCATGPDVCLLSSARREMLGHGSAGVHIRQRNVDLKRRIAEKDLTDVDKQLKNYGHMTLAREK